MNAITLIEPIKPNPSFGVHDEDSTLFGNDPWIAQMLSDAADDNRAALTGTVSALRADINNARRLHQAAHDHGIIGRQYEAFARRICGLARSKAFALAKLALIEDQVIAWVATESERLGPHYRWPSWRACLKHFLPTTPKATKPSSSRSATGGSRRKTAEVSAMVAEIASLRGMVVTLTIERDTARAECKRLAAKAPRKPRTGKAATQSPTAKLGRPTVSDEQRKATQKAAKAAWRERQRQHPSDQS